MDSNPLQPVAPVQPQTQTQPQGLLPETPDTRLKLATAIQQLQAKGDTNTINQLVAAYKTKYKTGQPTVGQRVGQDIQSAGQQVAGAITGQGNPIVRGFQAAGAAFGAVPQVAADVLPSPLRSAAQAVLNAPGQIANWLGEKIGSTKVAQDFVQQHPDAANALAQAAQIGTSAGTIAGTILGAKGVAETAAKVPAATEYVANKAGSVAQTLSDAILKNNPAQVENYINTKYNQAIKPSMAGKTAPGQLDKYNASISDAVKSIVDNKPNLKLTDQYGEPVTNIPQNVDQFRQAIEQTKAGIFKQYDAIAKQAGQSGATVDLSPIAGELQKVADSQVVQDLHPELASYAASRAKTLLSRGSYTAETAQTAVQNLNKSLDSFYKNPTYETASKASVDALIANQLRAGLDKTIENAGGQGYGALKAKYGSLKNIETDVIKRGIVEARKGGNVITHLGDLASAEELIRGVATMNPQAFATGAILKSIIKLRDYLNSPNRAVKLLFEKADKANQRSTTGATIGNAVANSIKNPSLR